MRRPSRKGLSLVFAFCANIPLAAQDLHSIGREKPFSFAGGLSFNQVFYASSGIAFRRDPYTYFASGNLNLSLYGWSLPLSFNISNRRATFSQPFNQLSLHPTWKWISAHAGYTSMSFSPYTVNSHIFMGGGIELSPEANWKFSALYGRFLKASDGDPAFSTSALPYFQRVGYGLKATYGNGRNFIDLILFRAEDDKDSILPPPDSLAILPQENLVVSFGGGKTIFKHFQLKAELATSALTRDTRAERTESSHPLANAKAFFQPRLSSAYFHAFRSSFNYQKEGWLIGVAYERIDPEYRTLGAYYFNNDLENITANATSGLMDGKMNIAISAGMQRDNLEKTKVSNMRRMVGSFSANYTPSQRLNLAASWSSFQTFTNIRSPFQTINELTPYDNLDTLDFTQISTNAAISCTILLPGEETKRQNIHLNLTLQDAADQQGQARHVGTSFYNLNAAYSVSHIPGNMSIAFSFNTSINEAPGMRSKMLGPGTSMSRSFFNRKLRTTLSSSWATTIANSKKVNTVTNARLNGALTLRNKHNVSLSAVMVKRIIADNTTGSSFAEFTATLGYRYSFGKGR